MTPTTIIQYRTRPEQADENQRLIAAVMAELAAGQFPGLQYAAYRSDDGVTFMHVLNGDATLLSKLTAFREFQRGSAERLEASPQRSTMTLVGAYGC